MRSDPVGLPEGFRGLGGDTKTEIAMTTLTPPSRHDARVQRLLARLRRRQLDLAIAGQAADSAKYARRAWRVRLFGRGRAA